MGGCGGLERTDFYRFYCGSVTIYNMGGCGGLERTECVVALKELIFNSFFVLKEPIFNNL